MIVQANLIDVPDDDALDYGEGWLEIQWSDPLYGNEGLEIHLDGFCSRLMPFRCGQGPPEFVQLSHDHLKLRFSATLAKKLELDEELEIRTSVSEEKLAQLKKFVDCLP